MISKYQNISYHNPNLTQKELSTMCDNFLIEKKKYGKLYKAVEAAFSGKLVCGHFCQWIE